MQRSTFLFVRPDVDQYPSGGNKFNRRVLGLAEGHGWLLRSVPVEAPAGCDSAPDYFAAVTNAYRTGPASVILWDSLYLGSRAPALLADTRQALLLHYLPSLNPLLNADDSAAVRQSEDQWMGQMDFVITTGDGLAKIIEARYPWLRVYRCEPGIDAVFGGGGDGARRRTRDIARLLSVGNLTAAKGYRDLLAAISALDSGSWRWHIVGSGSLDKRFVEDFEQAADRWIRTGQICLHGTLNETELAQLMARVDIFVAASHYESYGMALAEAVAAGLPVVTADVGDSTLITRTARSSWMFPPGDATGVNEAIRSAIAALRDDQPPTDTAVATRIRTWEQVFGQFRDICEGEAAMFVRS